MILIIMGIMFMIMGYLPPLLQKKCRVEDWPNKIFTSILLWGSIMCSLSSLVFFYNDTNPLVASAISGLLICNLLGVLFFACFLILNGEKIFSKKNNINPPERR
jgi:hypothetical protein